MLSDDIKKFIDELERYPMYYNMYEVIDQLSNFKNYAVELEEEIKELKERLKEYEVE